MGTRNRKNAATHGGTESSVSPPCSFIIPWTQAKMQGKRNTSSCTEPIIQKWSPAIPAGDPIWRNSFESFIRVFLIVLRIATYTWLSLYLGFLPLKIDYNSLDDIIQIPFRRFFAPLHGIPCHLSCLVLFGNTFLSACEWYCSISAEPFTSFHWSWIYLLDKFSFVSELQRKPGCPGTYFTSFASFPRRKSILHVLDSPHILCGFRFFATELVLPPSRCSFGGCYAFIFSSLPHIHDSPKTYFETYFTSFALSPRRKLRNHVPLAPLFGKLKQNCFILSNSVIYFPFVPLL